MNYPGTRKFQIPIIPFILLSLKIPNLTWKNWFLQSPNSYLEQQKLWGRNKNSHFPKFSVLEDYFGIFLTTARKIPFKIPGIFWESAFFFFSHLGIFFSRQPKFSTPNKSQIFFFCGFHSPGFNGNYLFGKRLPGNFDFLSLFLPLSSCSKGILCCSYHAKTWKNGKKKKNKSKY